LNTDDQKNKLDFLAAWILEKWTKVICPLRELLSLLSTDKPDERRHRRRWMLAKKSSKASPKGEVG
jgi:hypothetical protein